VTWAGAAVYARIVPLRRLRTLAPWLVPVALAGAACVDAPAGQSPWKGWTTLRLKVKSAPLMRGSVELRVSRGPDERRLETTTRASFLGATIATSRTKTILDAKTGRPKEYTSYSKKKGRHFVFGDSGYTVEKLRPAETDEGDPWQVVATREFPNPDGDAPFLDYYGMLLQLGELALHAPGDEVTLNIATNTGAEAYRVRVAEARDGQREIRRASTGERRTLPTRELRLEITPADPAAEEGFLNMEGEVEIWVEAATGTLLEIVGKIPRIPGKVKLVLDALD